MKRVGLWLATVVCGLLGVAVSVQAKQAAPAAATRTLSIATLAPAGSTWMRVFDAWNREVRNRTNKALQFRFYPGGVQGDESEVIRKIRAGRLDGAAVTAVGLYQIHRPALAFQLPGLFATFDKLDHARDALNSEVRTAFLAQNFVLAGWADVGQSRIFAQKEVKTPADLASTRPWVWRDDAITPALYTAVSATPVQLGVPEVLGALQTNRINAFITSPVVATQLGWSTKATHMTNMQVAITIGATVFSKGVYDSLPADQRAILDETATRFHALARRNLRADESAALNALRTRGIVSVELDAAQKAVWQTAFTTTRTALTGRIADAAWIGRVQAAGR